MGKGGNVRFIAAIQIRCFFSNCLFKIQQNNYFVVNFSRQNMATTNSESLREWHPEEIISAKLKKGYACLVVNRQIKTPSDVVGNLWQNAKYRCTVDGGTNRWKDFLQTYNKSNTLKLPDFITGDFDSITKETSDYFSDKSIQRIHTPDQNYTDFTKAIGVLEPYLQSKQVNDIIVFHDTSGRIDQILANIQTLFKAKETLNLYLIAGNSLTWLLKPGAHTINIPKNLVDNERWCALLPVGGRATVTSTGLKWNLNGDNLGFGDGIVSSSNSYSSQTVHVETDKSIVWSMGVFNFHDD